MLMIDFIKQLLCELKNEPALFIATITAFAVIIQAYMAWLQNLQSVRPYIYADFEKSINQGHKTLHAVLKNAGLGPAIIMDYYIVYKKKKYRDIGIFELFKSTFPNWHARISLPYDALEAGRTNEIISLPMEEKTQDALQKLIAENFELVVKYRSFMSMPWLSTTYSSKVHYKKLKLDKK